MEVSRPNRRARPVDQLHEALIDRALVTYQPRARRTLDREDGREILHNLSGFLSVLSEWKRREKAAKLPGDPT